MSFGRKRRDSADAHVDVQRHQFLRRGAFAAVDVEHLMEVVQPLGVGAQHPTAHKQFVAVLDFALVQCVRFGCEAGIAGGLSVRVTDMQRGIQGIGGEVEHHHIIGEVHVPVGVDPLRPDGLFDFGDRSAHGAAHLVGEAGLGQVDGMRAAETRHVGQTDGLPPRERRAAIVTISIAVAVAVLSTAIANIALPAMARELQATPSASIWVVNAYQLAVTVTLLPLAALGDIYGYRLVYLCGLGLFSVASLACGLADTLSLLVVARVLQGFGAAGIISVNSALIRFIFPRAQLGRGISTMALVVATCSAAGPSLAAAILSVASWHWLFLFNVPFGVLAVWLALRSLPDTPKSGHRFDLTSAALNAVTFGLLLVGLDGIGHGQDAVPIALELVVGTAAAVVFIRRQRGMAAPMLPVDLFRLPAFALLVATSVCSYAAQTSAYLALPFYFAIAGGVSQTHIGLLITPWPAVVVFVAPVAGRLSDKYPAGLLGGLGLAVLTVGLLLMLSLPPDPPFVDVVWRMMVCGIGFGFFQSPNNRALIAAAPRSRSGVASGVISTARLTGQTIGGVVVAVIFGFTHGDIAAGFGTALVIGAGFSGFACVISFLRLRRGR